MPRKFFLILLFLLFVNSQLSTLNSSVLAADPPTPTGEPTCDLCGWCDKANKPKPPNWEQCFDCLYNPDGTQKEKTYYTVFGCISTDPSGAPFTQTVLNFIFGVSGGIAFLSVLWGAATILTSAGDPVRLQGGKDTIISSLLGILLITFSAFLLRVVGFDILKIPGFG